MSHQLTKTDTASLRKSDEIVFRTEKVSNYDQEAISHIECIKRDSREFGGKRVQIVKTDAKCKNFRRDQGVEFVSAGRASISAQHDETWQTVAKLLRPGDELCLDWWIGNDSPLLREAGLTHDMLYLLVRRKEKRMYFYLADQITDRGWNYGMIETRRKSA